MNKKEHPRTESINFRATPEEKEEIHKQAEARGMTLRDYFTDLIKRDKRRLKRNPPK